MCRELTRLCCNGARRRRREPAATTTTYSAGGAAAERDRRRPKRREIGLAAPSVASVCVAKVNRRAKGQQPVLNRRRFFFSVTYSYNVIVCREKRYAIISDYPPPRTVLALSLIRTRR